MEGGTSQFLACAPFPGVTLAGKRGAQSVIFLAVSRFTQISNVDHFALAHNCTQQLKLRENFHLLLLLLGISVSYICQTKYLLFVSPIYLLHLYCTYIVSLPLWPINIHDACFSFSVSVYHLALFLSSPTPTM